MRIRSLIVDVDDKTGFYFSTHKDDAGKEFYDMRLYVQRNEKVSNETHYFIEEPPAGLIKPLKAFIDGLIKEE